MKIGQNKNMYTNWKPKQKRYEAWIWVNAPNYRAKWELISFTETNKLILQARINKRLNELYPNKWAIDQWGNYEYPELPGTPPQLAIIQECGKSLEELR